MKLTFSLTALSISITFMSFQGNSFSPVKIKNEGRKIETVLSRSSKNAPGSDRYVLV